jgi:hypothetical protein
MSIFEIVMLLCFGAAWPVSIYKSYKSKKTEGKSVMFLFIIFIGYISGILHKLLYSYDKVIILYIFNSILVSIDIALFYNNKKALSNHLYK